jgi:hypothetical protein
LIVLSSPSSASPCSNCFASDENGQMAFES